MAFRVSGGARVHAVAFAEVVAGTCRGRTDKHDHDQQPYPSSFRHVRYTFSAVAVFRYAPAAQYLKRRIRSADFVSRFASLLFRQANRVEPAKDDTDRVRARTLNGT